MSAGIVTNLMTVTPDKAAEWLARNHGKQRNLSQRLVAQLAADIRSGNWHLTHQGIAFDTEGSLIDGQHRLSAIVQAGVPVEMLVSFGVTAFHKLDIGRKRTAGDILAISGQKNSNGLASALKLLLAHDAKKPRPWNYTTPTQDILRLSQDIGEDVQQWIPIGRKIFKRIGGSPAGMIAAIYICSRWSQVHQATTDFDTFLGGLESGVGLESGDSRLALASWLRNAGRFGGGAWAELTMCTTIRSFSAYIRRQKLHKILVSNPNSYTFTEWDI